jgi:hypothetical protein
MLEKPVVENHHDMKADASDLESRASTNILPTSDVEDEGLVVMLIEDPAQRGPQAVPSSPKEPLLTVQEEPVSSDPAPAPVAVSLAPASNPGSGEDKSTTTAPFDADLEVGPGSGVSLAEWNRKRFRAALGLPPKEPEKIIEDTVDAAPVANNASVAQEEKHSTVGDASPRLVSKASEDVSIDSSEATVNSTVALPQEASSAFVRPHTPDITLHAGFPISRSPTPSLRGSECNSPHGPTLHAVDWNSQHRLQEELDSDMEIDELDEWDESEDTLVMGTGASYALGINAEGVLKPATYNGDFSYQKASAPGWSAIDGVEGHTWHHMDPKAYETGNEVTPEGDLTPSQGAGTTDSQRKLFIRLPARGSKGGDAGMATTGTDASGSGSGSASPSPQSSSYRFVSESGKGGVEYDRRKRASGFLLVLISDVLLMMRQRERQRTDT